MCNTRESPIRRVVGIGGNNIWDENIGETDEGDKIKPIIEQKW